MLVLSRKQGQKVLVGEVEVVVLAITGSRVKLGFAAPSGILITRDEAKQRTPPEDKAAGEALTGG